MNTKYLTSIFALAAATLAAVLPTGSAYATSGVGGELDAYCARQLLPTPTASSPPLQSRPYRASGNSCALCHPGGNTNQFNTLGTATRSCTSTSCPPSVNSSCVNAAPTGTPSITAPAAGASVAAGTAVTFTGSGGSDPDGFPLSYNWTFSGITGIAPATGTSVSITPSAAGTLTATLEVRDAHGVAVATRPTRSITVTAANQAPNGTITPPAIVTQGVAATFQGSATDPNGDTVTYAWSFGTGATPATSTAQSPSVTFSTTGSRTVSLTVTDSRGLADPTPASVTVNVAAPANQAPNGSITVPPNIVQNQAVTFSGSGTDLDNNLPLTYAWNFGANATPTTSTAQNPSVTFSTTGSRTVTLTVTDSLGTADPTQASVTVTVNAPQPPVANADTYSVQAGQTLTVAAPGVLGNDTNPAGTGTLTAQVVTNPASGTLTLNANGSFTYVPTIASGPVSFTYRTTNGTTTSANATVTINVSAAPTPPVATNDTYSVQSGQTLTVAASGVLGNDSNPAGTGSLSAQLVTGPTSGTLSLNPNGSFTYTPATGFAGPATFTYRSTNGTTTSANATVTINVAAAPPAPVASADSYSVQSGQTLTVAAPGVLGNDTNPAGTGTLTAQLVTGPASGTLSLNPNGGLTYTPAAGFTGNASFTYRVANGTMTSANATVTISVSAAPQPPVANNDSYTVQSGQTLTVAAPGVLSNDTNPAATGTLSAQVVTNPTSGTLSLNANGSFTYTPAAGFTGNASFTYRVTNGTTNSANATVTINVTAPPPPPPAPCTDADADGFFAQGGICGPRDCNDSNAAINPGASEVCGDGVDNDCDGTMDSADKECNGTDCLARFFAKPVVITQASWGPDDGVNQLKVEGSQADPGAAVTVFNAATGALLGTTTADSTGTEIGQWEFEFNTNTPPCRVRVTINGQMAEQSVSNAPGTCVGAPAPGPVANANSYSVVGGTTLTVAAPGVLGNDTPTTGLSAAVVTNPTSGTLNLAANGGFTYTPAAGFSGTATFTYRASNGTTNSAPATVTITVTPPAPQNQAPNGTITPPTSIVQGQAATFRGSATDPNGDTVTYAWNFGTNATPATATGQNASVIFSTAGSRTVTLTVTDSRNLADPTPASVQVTVASANRPPEGTIIRPTGNWTVERGHSVSFQGIGSDPDGNTPLTYSWDFGGGATNSTLQNPRVRFSRNGTYTVRLTVRDSRGLADPTPATITVRVVEDR